MKKVWKYISAILLVIYVYGLYLYAANVPTMQRKTECEEVIVAVLDTGYTGESDRVIEGKDVITPNEGITDGNGHGSNIIDIILSQTSEQVKVLAVKTADYNGRSTEDALYQGIEYAMENGADIIHISMNMNNTEKESRLVKIVNEAIESGIAVTVSAGNYAKDTANVFPANIDGAIVVSAVDAENEFCSYSNYGKTIDFSAYGTYQGDEGTSYATARVTAMLAEEYLNGGSIETLKGKAVDAGAKGKDSYYGYGILKTDENYETESDDASYIGKSGNDIGYHILDIDWEKTDAETLDSYFVETDRAYVGMYLSGLSESELEELKKRSDVLNTNVLVQEFELSEQASEYREVAAYEESFIENAVKEYQDYEKQLAISAAYLILIDDAYFAVSSENRNDVYYFHLTGFHYTVDIPDSPWFNMFNPSRIRATRTTVKQSTDFGAVYVTGFSSYLRDAGGFATRYTDPYSGQEITTDFFYAIDVGSNISLSYGLVISIGGYSNYREGYHTEEQDIIQLPYNYTHAYPEYSYAQYKEPLQYLFSYYNASTNDTEYSTTPQVVKTHAKNFRKLIRVNQTIWHDGVYKDGYDYRNVDESLSLSEKLGKYLVDWDSTVIPNVNIYSSETSLTSTGFNFNANLMESLGIQWNNGETSTVAVRNDIPEYNFPLVINTYTIRYNGNGATSGTMSDTAMTYNVAKNLSANQYSRTGYVFKGWATAAGGPVVYTNKQAVSNLTLSHNVVVNLYAVWEPITYTIRFHGNGFETGTMADLAMTYDVQKALTANKFSKAGYTFKEWNTKADGSGTSYANSEVVKNLTTKNGAVIDLYAQWDVNQYIIRYNGNGATSGNMADTSMTYGVAKKLSTNKFAKTGYFFVEWNTKADGSGTSYANSEIVKNLTTKNGVVIDLYAQWEPITYLIRFHGNNETGGSMLDMTMTYDAEMNLTINGYYKTGYTFFKWNTKADGSGTFYADGASVKNLTITNGAVVDLYAQWNPNQYTIHFHNNGGVGTMNSISAVYDVPVQLNKNTFIRSNDYGPSVFIGWNTDADVFHALYMDEETVINLTDEPNGVVDLYAIWDDCPWIIAEDLYYTLEDAQSGRITYDELMSHATAEDREAGGLVLPGIDGEKGTSFVIIDYAATDFTQFQHEGSVTETYRVIDSIGNQYQKMITVYIVDSSPVYDEPIGTTRFINEKYYNESFENGGLEDNSLWKTDPEYVQVIQAAFANSINNTPILRFYFTREEMLQMKEFVRENGVGNVVHEDALQRFYDEFMAPNVVR